MPFARTWLPALAGAALVLSGAAGLAGLGPGAPAPGIEAPPDRPPPGLLDTLAATTLTRRAEADEGWARRLLQVPPEGRRAAIGAGTQALQARLPGEPTDGSAWLTLAMLDLSGNGLRDSVTRALRLSYYTARNEMAVMRRRITLSLLLWPQLPTDVGREALLEVDVLCLPGRDGGILRDLVRAAVRAGPAQWATVRERCLLAAPDGAYLLDTLADQARAKP